MPSYLSNAADAAIVLYRVLNERYLNRRALDECALAPSRLRLHGVSGMRHSIAFILAIGAAYAMSFALDLLFGAWAGPYDATAYVPVITWGVLASGLFVSALALRSKPSAIFLPIFLFSGLALVGAVVGRHPDKYAVAGVMALEGVLVRQALLHRIPKGWLRVPRDQRTLTEDWNDDDRRGIAMVAAHLGWAGSLALAVARAIRSLRDRSTKER